MSTAWSSVLAVGVDMVVGAVVLACAYLAWEAMGRRTRHCYRFVYGLMGVAALGVVLLPLYPQHAHWELWLWRAMGAGFAFYLVLDRRRIDRVTRT